MTRGLPDWLWSVLYRSVHFISSSWDGKWKTGRSALPSLDEGQSMQALWQARTSGSM